MPFTPTGPYPTVTWQNDTASTSGGWNEDAASIAELFDLLADSVGNLIADTSGTTINLFGGYTADVASTPVTIINDTASSAVTWTAR